MDDLVIITESSVELIPGMLHGHIVWKVKDYRSITEGKSKVINKDVN